MEFVTYEVEGAVGIITNQPPKSIECVKQCWFWMN